MLEPFSDYFYFEVSACLSFIISTVSLIYLKYILLIKAEAQARVAIAYLNDFFMIYSPLYVLLTLSLKVSSQPHCVNIKLFFLIHAD